MTLEEQRKIEEQEIKDKFSELQNKLSDLKQEVQKETDVDKKREKEDKITELEQEAKELELIIKDLESLQQEALDSLKDRLQDYAQSIEGFKWEVVDLFNEIKGISTYDLLRDSPTIKWFEWDPDHPWLLKIIETNPNEFKDVPWDTAEKKLEYIFDKIRRWVVLFLKNKLWSSTNYDQVINNTIAPAIEWNLINLLRENWNKANKGMLEWLNNISWENLNKLLTWTTWFYLTTSEAFNKFSGWMNAVDYLSIHNWVLRNPEKSKVLTNPIEFQKYLSNAHFSSKTFSPYEKITDNIFEIDENQTYSFGISDEKDEILKQIWEVKVVNNPTTTSLIAKLADKPEKFLEATSWWKDSANILLDWIQAVNSVTSAFWLPQIDIMWESSKPPQDRHRLYKVLDFVFKLIWVSWWLEWTIRRWRLDKLSLTDEKNDNITAIFKEYQNKAWKWGDISITDKNSCDLILKEFELTDLNKAWTTRWDYLRDMISDNVNLDLISPIVVKQTLWNLKPYVIEQEVEVNWKKQKKEIVNVSQFTDEDKKQLAHNHINNMREYFSSNFNNLQEFYKDIHNTDDIALCMTTSLYANKEDVVEGVKAKVFLPENYYTPESTETTS